MPQLHITRSNNVSVSKSPGHRLRKSCNINFHKLSNFHWKTPKAMGGLRAYMIHMLHKVWLIIETGILSKNWQDIGLPVLKFFNLCHWHFFLCIWNGKYSALIDLKSCQLLVRFPVSQLNLPFLVNLPITIIHSGHAYLFIL